MFFEENAKLLADFAWMSQSAGTRSDYVQGGGGNTSVKLAGGLMAIKASGFCLSDIDTNKGYAVLNGANIRDFYLNNEPSAFENAETSGSECTKANVVPVEGLAVLRPSVEAGFHSILKTFVLHTHSVYANLAACTVGGKDVVAKALSGADYSWGWVDYQDPGAMLAFSIRDELRRVEKETGKVPSVIIMQNHGIIVHDDDAANCEAIHADANERLAAAYGMTGDAFPTICVKEMAGGVYAADTPYLKEMLLAGKYGYDKLANEPLYPDQMVFFADTFYQDIDTLEGGKAVASSATGEMLMRMGAKKALTLTETLTAVFFIWENVEKAGFTVSNMSAAARNFIANWESEKYRKSLSDKK